MWRNGWKRNIVGLSKMKSVCVQIQIWTPQIDHQLKSIKKKNEEKEKVEGKWW